MSGRAAYFGGLAAEEAVERAYGARGARILARRWRCAAGEIDLIVDAGETIVFVEVKKRASASFADPPISHRQWTRVAASAEVYMSETGRTGGAMRFDAALVDAAGSVTLIENAWMGE